MNKKNKKITAGILVIGNEILSGRTIDKNISFLALWLNSNLGIKVSEVRIVPDIETKIINNVIRKKLGFKGIIISDDISMKALKFDLVTNAKKSLKAGCNIVLYCAGKSNENLNLIKSVPYIDEFTRKKTSEIFKYLR